MSKKHLVYLILILGIVALLMGWLLVLTPLMQPESGDASLRTITLDGETIRVWIADTDAARQLGLGGRDGLAEGEGMLFVFPADGKYSFWMKDMRFAIDILWISADGKIVYIAPNISPDTYPQDFVSTTLARDVLELPAGYAARHGVGVGDTVQL